MSKIVPKIVLYDRKLNLIKGNPPGTKKRRRRKADDPNKLAFNKSEASRMLSIGVRTLEGLIAAGELKASHITKQGWRIAKTEIEDFLRRTAERG